MNKLHIFYAILEKSDMHMFKKELPHNSFCYWFHYICISSESCHYIKYYLSGYYRFHGAIKILSSCSVFYGVMNSVDTI